MFLLSNYILRELHVDKPKNLLALYSIAIGLIVYVSVYLYVLYYHKEQLPLFNNLLIYVLSLDLLLSGALYNQTNEKSKNEEDNTDFQSEVHSLSESLSEDICTTEEELEENEQVLEDQLEDVEDQLEDVEEQEQEQEQDEN